MQITSNVRESQLQSAIAQHQQQNQSLQDDSTNALTSLDENDRKEVAELQNNMVLDRQKAQTEACAEIEHFLAEKNLSLNTKWYSSKINSLDNQIRHANALSPAFAPAWQHLVGKKPVATYSRSSSDLKRTDEEPQTDSRPSLTSLLGDVPIMNATIGMLAEALAKVLQTPQMMSSRGPCPRRKRLKPPVESFMDTQRQDNKANVRELFKNAFHATKDEEFMLHVSASHEAILSFAHGTGPGPDPLAMRWDMTTHTLHVGTNMSLIYFVPSMQLCLEKGSPTSQPQRRYSARPRNKWEIDLWIKQMSDCGSLGSSLTG
ncbi:hypothetical protein DFJ58DRAFT_850689 [Suillus subalutaceus]|uniref:uncharacterized protein n=1 Tax=Suillus subalutaceus TaxID=48586 RepID=UPI001B86DC2C|nr:uncharacterized protein DFJ58DRAFT_850689 [Suillus subalutaceus]KAG1813077.1 hypothetical protein DFJ58DRAFT_850689 [Suillus subalutaceus]